MFCARALADVVEVAAGYLAFAQKRSAALSARA
jgi:hypothetical protein